MPLLDGAYNAVWLLWRRSLKNVGPPVQTGLLRSDTTPAGMARRRAPVLAISRCLASLAPYGTATSPNDGSPASDSNSVLLVPPAFVR